MKRQIYLRVKRAGDIAGAAVLLTVTAPIQFLVGLMIRKRLGKPVLFSQERPGLNGQLFRLHKFRTMLPIDAARNQVTNEERTHPFGQLIRSTSLDELPSLWNVLVGDMSFVGPRPLRAHYLPRYSRRHMRRHEVRPGLTGLAQVSGRNAVDWNTRLDLDVKYVDNLSPLLDLTILTKTLLTVIKRTGIREEGQASMSEFFGSGPSLTYRRLRERDLEVRVAWLNDPATRRGISIDFEASLSGMSQWYEKVRHIDTRADYVCTDSAGQPVSMFGFVNIDGSEAELYLYVSPKLHGQGIGRLTMVQLLRAAEERGLNRLKLEVKRHNITAQALYQRFGFEHRGELPDGKLAMLLERPNGRR